MVISTPSTNPDFSNFIASKPIAPIATPVLPVSIKQEDIFNNLKKQLDQSLTFVVKFKDDVSNNISGLVRDFDKVGKSAQNTVKTIKAAEQGIDAFGFTLKGVGKELFQVGSAIAVVAGSFFQLQQDIQIVTIPIKGIVDAFASLNDKSKGLDLADSIGINTTAIHELDLFRAGLFGNIEALQAFRTASQTQDISFTLNLTKLNTILKVSKEELRGVGNEAKRLSKDLNGAVSASDIVAGQYQIASAGFTNSGDSRQIAEASAKLSVVGFNDFFSTAELVTKSLRAYGLEASKAGDVAAKLNAVVEVGITTIPELSAGFAETAVTAKAFGIDLNQLGAAVATITTQGTSTPEALTGIEALFRTLASQTPQAVKALGELSLNGQAVKFDLATVQAKGLGNALTDVFKAANGNVSIIREIIPESRALQAALALAAQGGALFADSLAAVSNSSPAKLNLVFGEVQEDPTIKLRGISTKAEELVAELGGSFTGFTDGAIKSLDVFVSSTEVLADLPGVKQFISTILIVGDTVGKVVGVVSSLGGAILSVVGILATINVFNNLFSNGLNIFNSNLASQGKLIGNAILNLGDYGSALKQVVGIDVSKNVKEGLIEKLDELKAKSSGFSAIPGGGDTEEAKKVVQQIKQIETALIDIQIASEKPIKLNIDQIEAAKVEVLALEEELSVLRSKEGQGTITEQSANSKNIEKSSIKQHDKVAEVGKLKLEQEGLLRSEVAKGTITADRATELRAISADAVDAVSPYSRVRNNDGKLQKVTPIQNIQATLEEAKVQQPNNSKLITNLSQSLVQASTGTQGLLNKNGELEKSFVRTGVAGEAFGKVGQGIARVYTALSAPFARSTGSIKEVDQALRLAGTSEGISNIGQAAGKLFSTAGSGLGLLKTGAINAGKGLLSLGGSLISQFLNPLTLGLAAFAVGIAIFDRFQQSNAFRADTIEKNAEAEKKRTQAIESTNRALAEQKRIESLVKGGLSEEEATKKVKSERQEKNIQKAVGNATGARRQKLQTQLATKDFRTSDEFLIETLAEKRDNRLGLSNATDGGQAKRKLESDSTGTLAIGTAGAIAGGGAAAIGIALSGGSIAVGSAVVGAFGVGAASAGATIGTALGAVGGPIGILIGAGIGLAIGLAVSQLFATIEANGDKETIKKEALNRKETELNDKFKVDKATTPQEREKRRSKVKAGLDIYDKEIDVAQNQAGLNDGAIDTLRKQYDPISKDIVDRIDLFSAKITELKTDTDSAISSLNKNQLEAGLLSEDLTTKANRVLSGRAQITAEDTSRIDSELQGRIASLKVTQQGLEETLNDPKLDNAQKSAVKDRIVKGAKQIEDTTNFGTKFKAKLVNRNTDIINQTASGQGVGASAAQKEETSAVSSINNIKKALETDTDASRNTIPSLLDSLKVSSENLESLDISKFQDITDKINNLINLKDTNGASLISKLDPKVVLGVINTVTDNVAKLAADKVGKLEASAKRLQGLASNSEVAGSTVAKESIDQTELQIIDVKIKAQEIIAATKQGSAIKEKALNDLAQLQLDKKNKTIEARITKEINASNLLYEREKARLGLAQSDLEIKQQIFEKFGIRDEGGKNTTAIANNKEKQFQLDQKKERDDFLRQQQASVEQSQASVQTNLIAPISLGSEPKLSKFDSDNFAKEQDKLQTRLENRTTGANDLYKQQVIADQLNGNTTNTDVISRGKGNVIVRKTRNSANREKADIKIQDAERDFEKDSTLLASQKGLAEIKFAQQNNIKNPNFSLSNLTKTITGQGQKDNQTDEIKRKQLELARAFNDKQEGDRKQAALQKQLLIYDGIIKDLEIVKNIEQDRLNLTVATTNAVLGSNSIVGTQQGLKVQLTENQQNYNLEKKRLDLKEKALRQTGTFTPEAQKDLKSQRGILDNKFKNDQAVTNFQGKKDIAEKSSASIQESLSSTVALAGTLKQIDITYVSQANSLGAIGLNNRLQVVAATESLSLEREKLVLQEEALRASGNLTVEAKKEIDTKRKLLDNQFASQIISLQFSAKQESIDVIASKLKSTIENKVKGLSLKKDALSTFAGSFDPEDETKDALDAKKLAGALSINIAVQQAALEENLLKIQQQKTKFTLEETQLKLKLLDIDLQLKEQDAKTPEQKAAIADARKSIAGLQGNVASQLADLPAQFTQQQQLQKQQSTLAVSTASLNYTKEFDPANLKTARQQFLAVNNVNLRQPVGDASVNAAVRSLNQQVQLNDNIAEPPKARNDIVRTFRSADGSISNINPNPTAQIDYAREKNEERIGIANQRQAAQVKLLQDGSITNVTDKNNTSQNSGTNNNAFTVNVNVNGNADNAVANDIGKSVRQELLELSRRFQ